MKPQKPWAQALHIPLAEYVSWTNSVPKNESLTFWCLESGHLEEDTYLQWAREHYGMASLTSDFFAQEPDREFWSQIQSVANWSPAMVPVAQWDGVVFVACVEPVEDVNWSFPVRYVLAHTRDLKHYWQNLMTTSEKSYVGIPPTPDKQTVSTVMPTPDKQTVSTAMPSPEVPATSYDEPAGLNLNKFASPSAPSSADFMEALQKQFQTPTAKEDLLAPENLSWKAPSPTANENINAPQGMTFNFNMPTPPTPTPVSAPTPAPTPVAVVAPTPTPPPPPPSVSATTEEPTRNFVMVSTPQPPANSAQFSTLLPRLKADFIGAMILDVKGEMVVPNVWDENFKQTSSEALTPISLSTPSAFRVAARSKMPYLGRVVDTPVNTGFFKNWGFATPPDMILVQPVVNDSQVTHLIFCLCDKSKKSPLLLRAGDKAVEGFMKLLSTQKPAA